MRCPVILCSESEADVHKLWEMRLPGSLTECMVARSSGAHRDGLVDEIAAYCESDVVNTYRVWLRYELFRGKLTDGAFQASGANLSDFIKASKQREAAFEQVMPLMKRNWSTRRSTGWLF